MSQVQISMVLFCCCCFFVFFLLLFLLFVFFFFFFFFFIFIIVILNYCKVDYKVFIIRNNKLIYLSRMKSCLWGWSCYHYSLAQRPISHRIHLFLTTLSNHMQVRNLRNRLRVNMVCEWAWVSIAGERDLPESLNRCSRLEFRSHVQVHTHARAHKGKRAHVFLITMALKQKQKWMYSNSAH